MEENKKRDVEELDQEMLENIDFLSSMDELEEEENWDYLQVASEELANVEIITEEQDELND